MTDETLPLPGEESDAMTPTTAHTETQIPQTIETVLHDASLASDPEATAPVDLSVRAASEERYTIGAELARGGMGAVLTAKDLNLRRDVAMKVVLKPEQVRSDQLLRFVHEAQVTGQLEHPSIVPVYELGVDAEGQTYYTMKYIRGTNLGDILKSIRNGDTGVINKHPLPRLLNIYIKACDALAFAHSRGVIHRDLKPDNIMVGDFGEVLIVDWGLAKVLGGISDFGSRTSDSETGNAEDADHVSIESVRDSQAAAGTKTLDGAVMGTPAYMAPEQADGDLERMGPPADIYAMGAILYAILTLEAPFTGDSVNEILNKVLDGDFVAPDLREGVNPHCVGGLIPASLSSVVMKAMSADPEERYVSVKTLQADVQAYLDGFATRAEDAGPWRLLQLFVARHRAIVLAAALGALAFTVLLTVAFVINLQARRQAETALHAFEEEQALSREVRKNAAPALVRAARTLIERKDLAGAASQVDLARDYDPTHASAHLLAAQVSIVDGDYAKALAALHDFRALLPDDDAARRLEALCRQAEATSEPELHGAFAEVFVEQEAWLLAYRLKLGEEQALALYRQRLKAAWPDWSYPRALERGPDGHLVLRAISRDVSDLSPLKGMPIAELSLVGLQELSDLGPLRGMPLRKLWIQSTKVVDLSPLVGMPLRVLDARQTRITDLRPLAGLALKELLLASTLAGDLSPLKNMPLEHLDLQNCFNLSDLSPLKGLPLRTCRISGNYAKVTDISALRGMPLRTLLLSSRSLLDLSPLASCTELEDLDLLGINAVDISHLRGLPLKRLLLSSGRSGRAGGRHARTLAPLAGMPLEELTLNNFHSVKDLSHLRGMPLRKLRLDKVPEVSDLSPLEGLPLRELRLIHCTKLDDFSVIRTMTSLATLEVVGCAGTITSIDELPNLTRVGIDGWRGTAEAFRQRATKGEAKP